MKIKKTVFSAILFGLVFILSSKQSIAFEVSKLGIHILNTSELVEAKKLVSSNLDWSYVTIPITHQDVDDNKTKDWQAFFDQARELKIIPIVRLTTEYSKEKQAWEVPNKKDIVNQLDFLSRLNWPTDQKHIIVYNEVNHTEEWGGYVDPAEYASIFRFVSNWAHTEQKNYVVLPAAMDLAAPNGKNTLEAFNYLAQMHQSDPEIFSYVDVWNSHSYPNPGFSSSPTRFGKNSLRGFQYELDFVKNKSGQDLKVMITETGWSDNSSISRWLSSYYSYAMQHIWSDERVIAVTPFLLKGSPGPFSGFSFFDSQNQPTNQYYAFQSAIEKISDTGSDPISYSK